MRKTDSTAIRISGVVTATGQMLAYEYFYHQFVHFYTLVHSQMNAC